MSVTTQVLLRSVVESSHCPIMFFFSVAASCACAGDARKNPTATNADSAANASERQSFMSWPLSAGLYALALIGVSATGVNTGFPANQAFRLSTTS